MYGRREILNSLCGKVCNKHGTHPSCLELFLARFLSNPKWMSETFFSVWYRFYPRHKISVLQTPCRSFKLKRMWLKQTKLQTEYGSNQIRILSETNAVSRLKQPHRPNIDQTKYGCLPFEKSEQMGITRISRNRQLKSERIRENRDGWEACLIDTQSICSSSVNIFLTLHL